MIFRLHLLVTFVGLVIAVLFSFALRGLARHVTYLYSAAGCVVVNCLFVFCFCVRFIFFWLCVAPSVRAWYHSFTLHAPSYHFAFLR